MNLRKYLFAFTTFAGLGTALLYGENPDGKYTFQQELEENDDEELLAFITAKRSIPLADKVKYLHISGEIHAEWNHQRQRIDGKDVRIYNFREMENWEQSVFEPGDHVAIGPNDFDVQLDLFFDWKSDRIWGRSHLRFDNSAGVSDNGLEPQIDPQGYHGSGSIDNLALREAYIGYEVFKCDNNKLTVEVGRRGNLYKVFYSEVEFSSRLDGIILKYSGSRKGIADWYITGAGFVVDERANQFAWAGEVGLSNIMDSGIDFKYSYVDWQKHGKNRFFEKNPIGWRFKVSQFSLLYTIYPKCFGGHELNFFGAFLVNHIPTRFTFIDKNRFKSARPPAVNPSEINPSEITPSEANPNKETIDTPYEKEEVRIGRQNLGGFIGFQYREIEHEGDWFLKAYAAFCQAQCIPDNDVRNIGAGNLLHESMTSDGRGNTNWQGYSLKLGYALTDQLVLETQYDHSWNIKDIAGTGSFNRFAVETTYSF